MHRRLLILALAWSVLAMAGCQGGPRPAGRNRPLASLERVLWKDLSASGLERRVHGITETASTLAAEPGRAARVPAGVLRAVDMPAAANAPATLGSIARAELRRAPTIPALVRRTPDAATIRRDAATIAREVFGDGTPLDEIDDARHRTDPLDDRPEATLWQRIRRRLHL